MKKSDDSPDLAIELDRGLPVRKSLLEIISAERLSGLDGCPSSAGLSAAGLAVGGLGRLVCQVR